MKDLKRQLEQLEQRHSGLSKSYESLQQEYSFVKAELDTLRKENCRVEKDSKDGCPNQSSERDPLQELVRDPVLFQVGDLEW
jgi:predicted nuclease with TOPRIM domain